MKIPPFPSPSLLLFLPLLQSFSPNGMIMGFIVTMQGINVSVSQSLSALTTSVSFIDVPYASALNVTITINTNGGSVSSTVYVTSATEPQGTDIILSFLPPNFHVISIHVTARNSFFSCVYLVCFGVSATHLFLFTSCFENYPCLPHSKAPKNTMAGLMCPDFLFLP